MRADEAVRRQLVLRLARLRRRATEVAAEIVMVEQLMADVENRSTDPRMKLRKNGMAKLGIQAAVRGFLEEKAIPTRAKDIFYFLRGSVPALKSSTFRSHIRRMVEAGIIMHDDTRGFYRISDKPVVEDKEHYHRKRVQPREIYSYEKSY